MPKLTNKLNYSCDLCNKSFNGNKYQYERHLFRHKLIESKFRCEECDKQFYSKWHFVQHSKTHASNCDKIRKVYVCDYCKKTYINKINLQKHIQRMHENINVLLRYECDACDVSYCENRLLVKHIRNTHLGYDRSPLTYKRKPLNTPWVERLKNTDGYIKMTRLHENVISVEKYDGIPIIKTEIKEEYIENDTKDFENVKPTGIDKVECSYCNKKMYKKSLEKHIQEVHLTSRKFVCEVCNQSYFRRYLYLKHKCGHSYNLQSH